MFGNHITKQARAKNFLTDSCTDEILFEVHRLNKDQEEQFFEWLDQHLCENNFNATSSSRDERLRAWLNLQSTVLLLLEYQIILEKVEHFRSNDEEKN